LCVRGSMGSLPSLAGLSLCEHGRRGGSAVLPASSSGIATDAPMLVWSVHMNRILFRYFPAIEASEDGESVVHDDDDEYDVVDAASDEEEAAIARNGPVTKRQRKKALTPYQAYLQWLRLCRVPSVPMKFTGAVKSIVDSEQLDRHLLDSAIRKANNALYETFKMGGERIQPAKIKQRVNFVNKASGPTLASVHISTLNASGRRKREDLYMKWLTSTQSTDGYTANRLDSVDESIWVDHIVPKSWLRLTNNFEEFASCENDPSNVVLTRKTFNENKHDKAIYFGNTGFFGEKYIEGVVTSGVCEQTRDCASYRLHVPDIPVRHFAPRYNRRPRKQLSHRLTALPTPDRRVGGELAIRAVRGGARARIRELWLLRMHQPTSRQPGGAISTCYKGWSVIFIARVSVGWNRRGKQKSVECV